MHPERGLLVDSLFFLAVIFLVVMTFYRVLARPGITCRKS